MSKYSNLYCKDTIYLSIITQYPGNATFVEWINERLQKICSLGSWDTLKNSESRRGVNISSVHITGVESNQEDNVQSLLYLLYSWTAMHIPRAIQAVTHLRVFCRSNMHHCLLSPTHKGAYSDFKAHSTKGRRLLHVTKSGLLGDCIWGSNF